MAVDRTWFNALVDDDGSGLTGSVWDKADIANLLNSVDAEIWRIDQTYAVPACVVKNSVDQPWGSGIWAPVPWGNDVYDPNSMHTPGDTRVYIPTPGLYQVSLVAQWGNHTAGSRQAYLRANGAFPFPLTIFEMPAANGWWCTKLCGLCQFLTGAPSEYVEAMLYQDSGASLIFSAGYLSLEVFKVRS